MFSFLQPYLLWIKIALVAAAIATVLLGWKSFLDGQRKIGYDKAILEFQIKESEAKAKALILERAWTAKWETSVKERIADEEKIIKLRSAALAADNRLRLATEVFNSRVRELSAEACPNAAITAAGLLGDCASEYRELAEKADRHVADLRQCLSAWPERN